ncbi:hypothetical protein, partial [Streptomyces eurythermus]|uniref:hypothetical protein n=1 Tax=Streptomyces eurythermus TaxID=42237 RepID=UPI0033D674D3
GLVTAADIAPPAGVEVHNPDLVLATLNGPDGAAPGRPTVPVRTRVPSRAGARATAWPKGPS